MKFGQISFLLFLLMLIAACTGSNEEIVASESESTREAFLWENVTMYFLLVDRFNNGDSTNDQQFGRNADAGVARGFMGGDLKGVTNKINDGYFDDLGITAIWFTPVVEQIHGGTDEGTGMSYGFHGYWARDWTALDPNFGTAADLGELVRTAHAHGIRIVLDVVLNHTGPVTEEDSQWPDDWVRTSPQCTYMDAESTISCTLVRNLPDILTDSESEVELPAFLIAKWKDEGRYEQEMQELDAFFERTGYPRAPKYYIIKWLADYVREFGIDGFRVDTAKHVEDSVWSVLYREASLAFSDWKESNPREVLDDTPFYMVGEVYGYSVGHGQEYPLGPDEQVNFFDDGFHSLINFAFKWDVRNDPDSTYMAYSNLLQSRQFVGTSVLNYMSSHDDGAPFDRERILPKETGTLLLLAPGGAQVYYGDELARPLMVPDAEGDAHLRSFMNWEDLEGSDVFDHWARLGKFRKAHPAIGAGKHTTILHEPFVFSRELGADKVVVAMKASGSIPVNGVFSEGTRLKDAYSGREYVVSDDAVILENAAEVILLSAAN